ncbi:MAG: aminotransferase class IV [Kiritimatiellae bacterium]|nr:aminotransferase class IV [Kiritimatiellia bacterium]
MRHLDRSNYIEALLAWKQPWHNGYYAMYSSLLDAVVTDPALMLLPIDDHLVHRGDGVFDTGKCVEGALYNFGAHLDRLIHSAAAIGLTWPGGREEIERLTHTTVRTGGHRNCLVRVILARGPGSFGVNPYDAPKPALYIVVYALDRPFMAKHPDGATARRSQVPPKPPSFAGIKNCNYLPNVMMKRESRDWNVDFVVGFDHDGHLTEGPTENAGIVTTGGELAFPKLDHILAGTTMLRVAELAGQLVRSGDLSGVAFRDITEEDIFGAAEMLIVGTSLNVVAVRSYEGRPIGTGIPGPIQARLNRLLEDDIAGNPERRAELL